MFSRATYLPSLLIFTLSVFGILQSAIIPCGFSVSLIFLKSESGTDMHSSARRANSAIFSACRPPPKGDDQLIKPDSVIARIRTQPQPLQHEKTVFAPCRRAFLKRGNKLDKWIFSARDLFKVLQSTPHPFLILKIRPESKPRAKKITFREP